MSRLWMVCAVLTVAGLAASPGAVGPAQARGQQSAPEVFQAVNWSHARFAAHKLMFNAQVDLYIDSIPRAAALDELRTPPEGTMVTTQTPVLLLLRMENSLPFDQHESISTWLDPSTLASLQSDKLVWGHKHYFKQRRFTRNGYYQWRAEPASKDQRAATNDAWSRRRQRLYRWEESASSPPVVTDPFALLYLLSAARLDRDRSPLQVVVFAKRRLVRLEFTPGKLVSREMSFTVTENNRQQRRPGPLTLRQVTGNGCSLAAGDNNEEVDLGFLGMSGELTVLLEYQTGIPVQINGKVKGLGDVTVRLEQVTLKSS